MQTYKILYRYDFTRDGHSRSLRIYKRVDSSETVVTKFVGGIRDLRLEIQGGDNALETAIVKTALHFSFEDCFDVPDTRVTVQEQTGPRVYPVKHGGWDDLYTPDATLYKVVLYQDNAARWSGYLTPDAWEEDLVYHECLSLTARDNIGHLDDIIFDLQDENNSGYYTAEQIITKAMERIGLAMTLDISIDDLQYLDASGTPKSCATACFNAGGLAGKTWYRVLEDVLDSLGLVLRYADNNTVVVRTLRAYSMDTVMQRGTKEVRIANRSGHISKEPALRMITEEWNADSDGVIFYTGQRASDYVREGTSGGRDYYGPSGTSVWSRSGSIRMANPYALTDPTGPRGSFRADRQLSLLVQAFSSVAESSSSPNISRTVHLTGEALEGVFTLCFDIAPVYQQENTNLRQFISAALYNTAVFALVASDANGGLSYYDDEEGNWASSFKTVRPVGQIGQATAGARRINNYTYEYSARLPLRGVRQLRVILYGFAVTTSDSSVIAQINAGNLYGHISRCELAQANTEFPKRVVNTVFNEVYNRQMRRSPEFGEINFSLLNAAVVKNGIFHEASDGSLASMTRWRCGETDVTAPLPALVHMGILAYHEHANNVLSATIVDDTGADPHAGDSYVYQGVRYLLSGGSVNMLNGYLENAVLREYTDYDSMWELAHASSSSESLRPGYSSGGPAADPVSIGDGAGEAYEGSKGAALEQGLSGHVQDTVKHVTAADKDSWNGKYRKPNDGIPITDLSNSVKESLGKADTALQSIPDNATLTIQISETNSVLYNGKEAREITIPWALSMLTEDATHRLTTDTEKAKWNAMTPMTNFNSHINNDDRHLTAAQKKILEFFGYDEANHAVYLVDSTVGGKKLSFYTYGEFTSGGVGSGGGGGAVGGVASIVLDGTAASQYFPDANGVIHMPPYPTKITWDNVEGKPTTIAGYGITDAITTSNIESQSVKYANSAGNADTLDGYHATMGSNTPYGTIPVIHTNGWMDVGIQFEFHYDNTTGSDFSTVLKCTGNHGNVVNLPSATGTLALTSDITWTNVSGRPTALSSFTDDLATIRAFQRSQVSTTLNFNDPPVNGFFEVRGGEVTASGLRPFGGYGAFLNVKKEYFAFQMASPTGGSLYFRTNQALNPAFTNDSAWHKVWDDSNSNKSDVDWSCKNLDANGNVTASGIIARYIYNYESGQGFWIGDAPYGVGSSYEHGACIFTYGNHPIYFYTGNTEKMRIAGNGNVVIGASDSAYKLYVNGSFNATSGYINGNGIIHAGNIGSQSVDYALHAGRLNSNNWPQYAASLVYYSREGIPYGAKASNEGFCLPEGAGISDGNGSIIRMGWLYSPYYHDIIWSPNMQDMWHRDVNGGSWRKFYDSGNCNNGNIAWACSSLTASGDITATGEITSGSDCRWKANIKTISDNPIYHLNPCEWDWKEGHGDGHSAGLIAQEVAEYLPFAVKGSEESGYTLNYNVFHAFEIAAIQNHETRIQQLEKENAELKRQIQLLNS